MAAEKPARPEVFRALARRSYPTLAVLTVVAGGQSSGPLMDLETLRQFLTGPGTA